MFNPSCDRQETPEALQALQATLVASLRVLFAGSGIRWLRNMVDGMVNPGCLMANDGDLMLDYLNHG